MRRLTFIIICMTIASIPISAQPPDTLWARTFGGEDSDHGIEVHQTIDDGYIIVGETTSFGAGDSDFWLIKTDSTGNEEWNRTFGGERRELVRSGQQTDDGGYIITGSTITFGTGLSDLWLIKTDSTGNEEWNRTLGGEYNDAGTSVQQVNDEGYIITGYTSSFGAGGQDVWLIKTNSTGNEVWNQTFGGEDNDIGWSVQQVHDEGYIILCHSSSNNNGFIENWLIKTDSSGNEEWTQTFAYREYGTFYSLQHTNDGGYIISGQYSIAVNDTTFQTDVSLLKTDSSGNVEWNQTFGGNRSEYGRSVQQTNDGGYIITGTSGRLHLWLIKTDSTGNENWNWICDRWYFSSGRSVQQTTDGGYIIAGTAYTNSTYMLLIRVDSEGNEVFESTASKPTEFILEEVYPNPFNSTTTISVALPVPSDLKLSVYNITGQEIAVLTNEQYSLGYHQFTFNADELSSGIYFIHASVPGKMDEVRKVVLVR
ncbi:MAG: T9SS type A sorting domain-containing protein [Candidatus Electryonea clarkiae]|nr:T9SS type A sorting domain-containing protein [Candidatus Electryonea clarkiae]MDP8286060.1 T9SS type A sorting domain-containing protein [Candidatus Electryonea clarkiae]